MNKLTTLLVIVAMSISQLFAQSITLTSPNGGQTWAGCTQQNITWTSTGTTDYYSLDYSTDNGSTWTSITSHYNTTSKTYLWTVPNTSSGSCLIKITDSNNSSASDQSDAVFTITSPLTLTSPNGGEIWEGSTAESITFNANETSNYYDIYYSSDAGSNWNQIRYNQYISSNNYTWNIPNTISTQCLVKMVDHSNSCMSDISDALFEISAAASSVTLSSPNGNEILYAGENKTIIWTASNTSGTYNLDYSTDNGSSWTSLASNFSGTNYSWTVPNSTSTNCLVRIMDSNDTPVQDISNTTFTIAEPYISITYPNGGENIEGCSDKAINFQSGGTSDYYKIEYSIDNGNNWITITSSYYSSSSAPSYTWTPIPSINSSTCLIRVTDKYNTSFLDQSDASFEIEANEDIIITTPNGGESWEVGSTHLVDWVTAPNSDHNTLYYSVNNGSSWTYVGNTYDTELSWTIPDNESTEVLFKVIDYDNSCILDISDANFTIAPPTPIITVTSPNTTTTLYQNNSYTIKWTSSYLESEFVSIYFSNDNGSSWNDVVTVTEDDGTYSWTIPETISSDCLIKVEEYENPEIFDTSDLNFNIEPPYISITSPNGNETFDGCSSETVTWSSAGTSKYFDIQLSEDNGNTWNTIKSSYYQTSINCSYTWEPVTDISSNQCLIKISDHNHLATSDVSDASFTIEKNLDIITTSPNGGEIWQVGDNNTISWVSASTSTKFKLYYSINNGINWNYITYVTTNSYNWNIPDNISDECLFKVEDYNNSCIYDITDANFSITTPTPTITITYPNSGNMLYGQNSYNITWTNTYNDADFVTIEYSIDNGNNWTEIINVTENSGSYSWTTPDVVSTECQLRISEFGNPTLSDITDNNFEIKAPFINVTSPNGGENILGCDDTYISWATGGSSKYYQIEYSIDNGVTWNNINSNYYSSSSTINYSWDPISNESSNQCLIRVSDHNNSTITDQSDNIFTITPNTDIIITNPNGGEILEVGDTYTINWVSASTSTKFNLYYSIDDGISWTYLSYVYTNYYNWSIPNTPSANCLFKVIDYDNNCIYDKSDISFTISDPLPEIVINSPNSGTYYYNKSQNITWDSEYLTSEFVNIDVSYDNGGTWTSIVSPTEDDGAYNWTIPETSTIECLVRVSEYGNSSIFDISNSTFTIAEPYITITAPNGDENLFGCETYTITWNRGGTSNYYKIEYSSDNGVSWNTITNSSYITASSYVWDPVTDIQSDQCLIRVKDVNYNTASDISDTTFDLNKNTDIILTAPNAGETWEVGTTNQITWASASSITRVNVYYSVDGGTNWAYITNTYSNYYNWTIPDNVSDHCYIKVQDYSNSCIKDVNDSEFSIIPPTPIITVNNPNSGTFYVGKTTNITWSSDYLESTFVSIDYSSDNGNSWNEISNLTEDDGTYNWTIPEDISSECLVRVSEYDNPTVFDNSNSNFTIAPPYITITSPNVPETFDGCSSMIITWARGGTSNSYKIEYSQNGGVDWNTISNSYYTTGTSYTWSTIPNINSSNCIIKISDAGNDLISDISDNSFTIDVNEDIIITSPNGGEFWQVGTTHSIEWVSASTSSKYYIYYSTSEGEWTYQTYTYSTSFSFTIPNQPSSECKFKIIDYDNSCIYDISDEFFSIIPADVELTNPNGGETFYTGNNYNITWTNEYIDDNYVKLEYSTNNGASWLDIVSVTENDGTFSWTAPDSPSDECLVKVTNFNDASIFDISDDLFTIAPSIVLITPNGDGGEVWRVCTETSITWTSGGSGNYFSIEYSIDNGQNWSTISNSYYTTAFNCSYDWILPNSPSSECLVRIRNNSNPDITDTSDETFTISPAITVSNPNGGESLTNSSSYDIEWISDGVSNFYNIDYSIDGGSSWTNIAYNQNITSDTYNWTVPSSISQNCLIKITDNINTCKTDQSNQVFAIGTSAISISVNSPIGGEILNGCTNQTISWSSIGTSDNYNLAYSIDGGTNWVSIVDNYNTTTKTYDWTIPNELSEHCLVRISDSENNNFYGISENEFEITTVIANAGENIAICNGDNTQLSATGGVTYTWLPTNGLSDPNISNPIANPTSTTTYTVFITNVNGCTDSDDITITVNPIPAAPVANSNSPAPLNGTLELTASTVPFANYIWTGPNGFASTMQNPEIDNATPSLDGTYQVSAVAYGCTSPIASTIVTISGSPELSNISGGVFNEIGIPVNDVSIDLTGDQIDSSTTGNDGLFDFDVNNGGTYTITPHKNNDIVTNNGVSTLDIILIQRHILGIQYLSSPYKIIAADVNRSQSVSTLDIVLTRAQILQTSTSFPDGDLWTFVNSDYVFPDDLNPFPYEATHSYSSAYELSDEDFVGIKLGDVNNSWNNNIAKSSNEELTFNINNTSGNYGETITIPVYAENFNQISGFQMSIEWNANQMNFVNTNNQSLEVFTGTQMSSDGILTCLWSTENQNGLNFSNNQILFEIQFEITGNIEELGWIEFNSEITRAEAYDNNLDLLDISLNGGNIELNQSITEIDNLKNSFYLNCYPNPFNGKTSINFNTEDKENIEFEIFNITGQKVWSLNKHFNSGNHSIIWNGVDSNGQKLCPGTYILKLRAGKYLKNHKLVIQG